MHVMKQEDGTQNSRGWSVMEVGNATSTVKSVEVMCQGIDWEV